MCLKIKKKIHFGNSCIRLAHINAGPIIWCSVL